MLLSHLIIALSLSFAPLSGGRPTAPPGALLGTNHTAEPGTLLGRHYVIQEKREPPAVSHTQHARYAPSAIYQAPRSTRRFRPFAQYIAERSDDVWAHEHEHERRTVDDGTSGEGTNYVSFVGGPLDPAPPPVEPAEPAMPGVAAAAPVEPVAPAMSAPTPLNTTNAVQSQNSTSTTTSVKKTKSKSRSKTKTHKS